MFENKAFTLIVLGALGFTGSPPAESVAANEDCAPTLSGATFGRDGTSRVNCAAMMPDSRAARFLDTVDPAIDWRSLISRFESKLPTVTGVDPYFDIYQTFQSKEAQRWERRGFIQDGVPLGPVEIRGQCGEAVTFAAIALEHTRGLDRSRLVGHQIRDLNAKLSLPSQCDHGILFVQNGGELLPGKPDCDIFFDGASAQFSKPGNSNVQLYQNVIRLGGEEGARTVLELFLRGYVEIPRSADGEKKVGMLLSSYAPSGGLPTATSPVSAKALLKESWTPYCYDAKEKKTPASWLQSEYGIALENLRQEIERPRFKIRDSLFP